MSLVRARLAGLRTDPVSRVPVPAWMVPDDAEELATVNPDDFSPADDARRNLRDLLTKLPDIKINDGFWEDGGLELTNAV